MYKIDSDGGGVDIILDTSRYKIRHERYVVYIFTLIDVCTYGGKKKNTLIGMYQ